MRTKARKRVLAWVLTAMLAVTCVPQMAFASETAAAEPAAATVAELTVLDGQVTVKNELATGSVTDGVVTVTAAHGMPTYKTNTVTVHNSTDKKAVVSFDYEVTDYNTTSGINGYTGLDSDKGTFTAVMDAAEYITITITGKRASSGCATLTMSNFAFEAVADSSSVTLNYDSALGSITAAGAAAAAGTAVAADYETGLALNAVPASGAEFLGWINEATGKVLSREAAFTYKPTADTTVKAVFVNSASEGHFLVGGSFIVEGINAAIEKAETLKSDKVIALLNDAVLAAGTYTIPADVTLLIPFDAENTLYRATPGGVHGEYATPVAYRTLTLASGAELVINGAVSLSAKHNAATSNTRGSGAPTGNVSFMKLADGSAVTVKDGGALYAYGYITGQGTVTAESGAAVYENFQIEDFRGGSATTYMAVNNMDKGVLPIAQYYVQNIEVPLTLEAGATEYCYTSLYLSSKVLGSSVKFISDEGAMFILEDGYVTKEYDGNTDRLIVKGNGNMSLSPIKVELEGQGIDSAAFELPINNNITVDINSGNVVINQDVALLPGAEINIAEGAVCTLGEDVSVYVYDLDQWGAYCGASNNVVIPVNYAPGKKYNRTVNDLVDAAVRVNGLLDASKGYIYTTTSEDYSNGGANVYSTANGTVIAVSGMQETTYQFTQNGTEGTFAEIFLLPANLQNEDGSYLQTLSTEPETYVYNNGVWAEGELHKHDYKAVVTAPDCEKGGFTTYTCECGDSYVADETAALGHKAGAAATCTTAQNCTVCGAELAPAKGHSYKADVKPATCTEMGQTTYTCECGDSYVTDVTEELGHKYSDWKVTAEATCTENGKKEKVCSNCGDTQSEIIKAAHVFENRTVEATCTEDGKTEKYCSVCGMTEVIEVHHAPGHNYGELVVIENQSCTKEGKKQQTCNSCGHVETYVIPMDAHVTAERITEPTCTAAGLKEQVCTGCGEVMSAVEIPALGHTSATVTTPATTGKAGSIVESCTACGVQLSKTTITKIGKTTIPAATFVYNGKVRKPVPTVKDAKGKKLVKGTDYTVAYKNAKATKAATAKNVGKYTVVVTFKGKYKGTVKKQFVINPQGTTVNKLTKPAKKQIKVTWAKRTAQVTGYEIQYSTTKGFTKKTTKTVKVTKAKTNSKVIKQLKAKKKYWVKIRTYKTVNNVKYYSKWSPAKTIVTK